MTDELETSATRLRAALRAGNRSAADLARACGLSRQNMQRFLDGSVLRSKHYPAIAKALDVHVRWLLTGDPASAPTWWRPDPRVSNDVRRPQRSATPTSPALPQGVPAHWQTIAVPHGAIGGPAVRAMRAIVDLDRSPAPGDLVLVSTKAGQRLRRVGPTIAGQVVLIAADGSEAAETRPAPLARASVVVGVLWTR